MVGLSRKQVFPKTKGDSITGQDKAQKHCDFRFSQIEKNLKSQFCNYDIPVTVTAKPMTVALTTHDTAVTVLRKPVTIRSWTLCPSRVLKEDLFCESLYL